MSEPAERRSPLHRLLEARGAQWGRVGGAAVALRFAATQEEAAALGTLALCDLSALPKLGVKGPGAEAWLRGHGLDLPPATYDVRALADGGLVARLGAEDFFLESGAGGDFLARVAAGLAEAPGGVYRVERQDATFLLSGARAVGVLAQLCSIDFRRAPADRLILTRAGGVNCGVLPCTVAEVPAFRVWVDPTYAVALWEVLAEISEELGGRLVGAACLYPDLLG
jgi:sarcosine oxidase, subunit gamma